MKNGIITIWSKRKYTIGAIISISVMILAFEKSNVEKPKPDLSSHNSSDDFPLRVINSLDNSQQLIAYTFYKKGNQGESYQSYCAVIKSIDPAKDNYKDYCRSVIADIVKTAGTDEIAVNIYDDNEAYQLSEVQYDEQYKVLNKRENDSIEQHTIATFYGDLEDENYTLWYYTQAHNRYTEKERYEPAVNLPAKSRF